MNKAKEEPRILARGVYFAPWLDPATLRPVLVVIDRRGCCIHEMIHVAGEPESELVARGEGILELVDGQPG